MAGVSKLCVNEMYDRFAYLATWLPNSKLKLGDVGIQDGGSFKRMTSLKKLGVPFNVRVGKTPMDFSYTSQSGISVKTKLAGELAAGTTLPLGKAGLVVEFSKEGAFLFQAVGCLVDEFEDRATVGKTIIKLHAKKGWDPAWSVVDTLVKVNRATILVSNSHDAKLELTANSPVAIAHLANAEVGLAVNSQQGDIVRFLAAKGLTPMFRLSRLKKSLLASLLGTGQVIHFGGKLPDETAENLSAEDIFEAVAPA